MNGYKYTEVHTWQGNIKIKINKYVNKWLFYLNGALLSSNLNSI